MSLRARLILLALAVLVRGLGATFMQMSGPFAFLEPAHSALIDDYVGRIVVGLARLAGRLMLA